MKSGILYNFSFITHDLGAAIAVVQVVSELDHATGAGIVGGNVAAVVRDGLGAHGAARAAHGLDGGVALGGVEGGCAGSRGLHRMRFLGCEKV